MVHDSSGSTPDDKLASGRRAREAGDLGRAFQRVHGALADAELDGADSPTLAPIQLELGEVAAAFGDTTEARQWLEQAEASFGEETGAGIARVHLALGRLDARSGVVGDARRRLRLALKTYESASMAIEAALCHLELADLYVDSGDTGVAQLELRAAQALRESDRAEHRIDARVVAARVAVARGDGAAAELELSDAREHAESVPDRATEVDRITASWNDDRKKPPRRFSTDGRIDDWALRFVSIVIGSDGMIGEAAVVDTGELDAGNLQSVRRFVNDVGPERRGFPVATEPRIEVTLYPDLEVFGLAFAFYEASSSPCGFSIIATGVEPDEERLARSDAAVSFYAGRWATDSYIGFSRHRAFRPGALTAVRERPIAFFVAYADVPVNLARACHERHLELSAAFVAMIQEDGDPARRLRAIKPAGK
jgi:tetratricopeptide (TPR) repeat protein